MGRRGVGRFVVPMAVLAGAAAILALALGGRGGSGGGHAAHTLSVGAQAPRVDLPSTVGQRFDLSAFRGKRNVLLYFYEHAG